MADIVPGSTKSPINATSVYCYLLCFHLLHTTWVIWLPRGADGTNPVSLSKGRICSIYLKARRPAGYLRQGLVFYAQGSRPGLGSSEPGSLQRHCWCLRLATFSKILSTSLPLSLICLGLGSFPGEHAHVYGAHVLVLTRILACSLGPSCQHRGRLRPRDCTALEAPRSWAGTKLGC